MFLRFDKDLIVVKIGVKIVVKIVVKITFKIVVKIVAKIVVKIKFKTVVRRQLEKWQVALVKLDPWYDFISHQVEKRSASWYSFQYRLVFGGTGSVEGTTRWYLEELGQY